MRLIQEPGRGLHLLCVDLRDRKDTPSIAESLYAKRSVTVITDPGKVATAVSLRFPDVFCFDFDLPDQAGLSILDGTTARYPESPFIVLTRDRSAEFAIRSLRLRAWDYFIKPVSVDELRESIALLEKRLLRRRGEGSKNLWQMPLAQVESVPRQVGKCLALTAPAIYHVQKRFDDKVSLENMARLCCMSKSHFSRTFKKENGCTFQEFLVRERINKGVELLKNTNLQITRIALEVGYSDLSNFTRSFKKIIGLLPTSYRKALVSEQINTKLPGHSEKFPELNPNPVLTARKDGIADFLNPSVLQLLNELKPRGIKDLLPRNHDELLKTCLQNGATSEGERVVAGRTFVWSYHAVDDGESVHIYGNEISEYLARDSVTQQLPTVNPNPVLSARADGALVFANPAVSLMLKELGMTTASEILPRNHSWLIKSCLNTRKILTADRKVAGHIIVWSYRSGEQRDMVYIYGHDISAFISYAYRAESLPSNAADPMFLSKPCKILESLNPAAARFLEGHRAEHLEDLLPKDHEGLIMACRITGATLKENREIQGRTITWSYHRKGDSEVYVYARGITALC